MKIRWLDFVSHTISETDLELKQHTNSNKNF